MAARLKTRGLRLKTAYNAAKRSLFGCSSKIAVAKVFGGEKVRPLRRVTLSASQNGSAEGGGRVGIDRKRLATGEVRPLHRVTLSASQNGSAEGGGRVGPPTKRLATRGVCTYFSVATFQNGIFEKGICRLCGDGMH